MSFVLRIILNLANENRIKKQLFSNLFLMWNFLSQQQNLIVFGGVTLPFSAWQTLLSLKRNVIKTNGCFGIQNE
jgi:hypothetical protein